MIPQASSLMDTVDEMLLDAGQEQDKQLRAALMSLGSLASLPAPAPNAQLAALLASRPDELSWRRRLRRYRSAVVGLAVVTGMGLGVTGVAASVPGPAENAGLSVQHLLEDWVPSWSVSGPLAAAAVTGALPEPSPAKQEAVPGPGTAGGQQEFPPQGVPDHPEPLPDSAPGGTSTAPTDDGGADHRGASGSAAADTGPRGPSEPHTPPDSAREPARQAQQTAEKLQAVVVPDGVPRGAGDGAAGHAAAGKKADPGAAWLKKISR